MCGISGYVGKKKLKDTVVNGLKKLEYRGYDSAGIAFLKDGEIVSQKTAGKVSDAINKFDWNNLEGNIGIGHTRWATHGEVSDANSHPHLSNDGKFAVVHNGIVENYQELKQFLIEKGYKFHSQTDSEVISNLIQYWYGLACKLDSLPTLLSRCFDAVGMALKQLEGNYAVLVLCEGLDAIFAARKGSPLVVGVDEGGYHISSDIPSFIEHTKDVVYLKEGDIGTFFSEWHNIYHPLYGPFAPREIKSVDWKAEDVQKDGFEHFMLKEITQQVSTVETAMVQDVKNLDNLVEYINSADKVFFTGCGSSFYACMTASYIFSKTTNKYTNTILASEFPYFKQFLDENSLVIAVSQSGETTDVLEAVKFAKANGSKVCSIVNVQGSSLTRESDSTFLLNAGPEICVLSTKSYTSQVALLTLLANYIVGNEIREKKKLKELSNALYHLTAESTRKHIHMVAEKIKDSSNIFCLGRGLQYPTALEAALKIKEVSYIHAEGFAGGELKHGSIALIEDGVPCIVFCSEENKKEIISNAMEVKTRGGKIIGVASENNYIFDYWIKVPEVKDHNPIMQIIPIQILAYQLAVLKGLDPDRPRNLAKSVCVK